TCLTASVLTLSAISCDRFIAIIFPLHVRITKQRTSVVISIIWLVSVAVATPFLLIRKYKTYQVNFRSFLEEIYSFFTRMFTSCDTSKKYDLVLDCCQHFCGLRRNHVLFTLCNFAGLLVTVGIE
ncbi:hypothetical protein AVEN_80167-1, partial [Araneus ventricosus]